jgi:16S rRNA processing protein RimM
MVVEAVTIGRIVKPVGLKGDVKLLPGPDFWPQALETAELDLISRGGESITVRVEKVRPKGGTFILRLSGVDDIKDAEAAVGSDLVVDMRRVEEGKMPPKPLPCQLIGLEVRLLEGSAAGKIVDMLLGSNQDCLIIEAGSERYLVPNVPEMVREVDLEAGRVVIDPPQGLRDLKW